MDNYDFYAEKVVTYLPVIIVSVIAVAFIWPNSRKRFLRIQMSLPTSKIKSVAMGLVEIQGKLIMTEPLISPVNKEECIGYYYTIEDINRDKEGKNSYTTVHRETKCNIFKVQDDSGSIEIQPDGIELILLKETNIQLRGQQRHTETLLKNGQEMLLVGSADSRNGEAYIRKDSHHKMLGITSVAGISVWNKYQPLIRSFLFTCMMIGVVIILILSKS